MRGETCGCQGCAVGYEDGGIFISSLPRVETSGSFFLEREIARRDERRIEIGVGLARFSFVRNAVALLLLGPSWQDHLAAALGRGAILAGYTVSFIPAQALVAQLARAHAENKLE